MNALTPISDLMTRSPTTVDIELPLSDARDRMSSERIRHLPVVRGERVVGMVSARDVMMFEDFSALAADDIPVESAMTPDPVSVLPNETLGKSLDIMVNHDIGALLVMDNDTLHGIFTDADAVRLLREALKES